MNTPGHEQTDLNPKYVLYFAVGLVALGVAVYVLSLWMFRTLEKEQARKDLQPVPVRVATPVPQPRLQISPQGDLEDLQRQEEEILTTYQWIDRERGTARIPINRAMELYLSNRSSHPSDKTVSPLQRRAAAASAGPIGRSTKRGGRGSVTETPEVGRMRQK